MQEADATEKNVLGGIGDPKCMFNTKVSPRKPA